MVRLHIKIIGLVLSAFLSFHSLVWAADGRALLRSCQEAVKHDDGEQDVDLEQAALCTGYVRGVYSTLYAFQEVLPQNAKVCFPNKWMESKQLTRIIATFLENNPDELNDPDISLSHTAFQSAFPCKR